MLRQEIVPLLLTLTTPRGKVCFKLPFVVLPGSGDLLILGQDTLQKVLNVDVIETLKQTGLELRD